MKNLMNKFLFLLSAIIIISCTTVKTKDPVSLYSELDKNAPSNTLTRTEKKDGWQLLFDGQNKTGWHGYNMTMFPDCWTIEDGAFTMTTEGRGESQDIITDKVYKSFAFSIEYKLTKGANSGIIFQVAEDPKYKFPYETGPEFQVIDQDNWPDTLKDWQICGANYAMYPPKTKPYKPLGEWNHILLVVNGNNVNQILNGEVVVEYIKNSDEWKKLRDSGKWVNFPDYGKYDEGHISLQNHGTKVWYRNIKIKEI
ncbi:MAG: DUF1080 domain-containing protein [Bacteroidetes bacterium]|nr:MAG: DUF1080 domain-containing protein [Bacteroidota bacterium]